MLHIHRSERSDRLVEGLAAVLREPPADPFAVEVVAVPAKGVERWVTQRLSHVLGTGGGGSDGVCANVRFPSPAAVVAQAAAAATGAAPADDPWQRGRVQWTLLEVIDECVGEAWCSTLAGHLGVGDPGETHRRGRRFTVAARLAGLFESYGAHRPQMLRDWAAGTDTDGAGAALADDLRWQAELWRRLRNRLGVPSHAERLEPACAALRADPALTDLPERLSLFGPTRLTTDQLEVLGALAAGRDVHLWLPHPSGALWARVAADAPAAIRPRRREDPTAALPRNPLLAGLGRDARELQLQLATVGADRIDRHHEVPDRPATLLGRLQRAVQDDLPPAQPVAWSPDDRSLQLHACHGPARQVEVLREVLVGLLAADPTLEPRDVLVMCPDIEEYAPLISATFGLEDAAGDAHHPGHRLRVRLADRSLRQTNPLLDTVAALLELADARVTASQVLDLAAAPPVRRRFRFTDDDLERLQEWVRTSGVRWGLDTEHRRRFRLQDVEQNTWQSGLDRILLGVAMAEDDQRCVGSALPLDDVDSNDIDLAGRLTELVERLTEVLSGLAGERPLADWLDTLARALDLLTEVGDADAWQSAQARRELGEVATDAGDVAETVSLALSDVRALLADRLQGRPTRANFRTGNLTMCSMVPMRSVPHRVVCLLGVDDARFPRSTGVDGDDVLARDPLVGERDPRSEDRQLLLDAVLAAREHLVLLYTGADPRTNERRPPAVPVGEILDAVDTLVRPSDGRPARDHVVVRHPLQPFDPRNFTDGALGRPGPFSFDAHALTGARRASSDREPPAPFLPHRLDAAESTGELALDDLVRFLEHPVKAFLRQRLGLTLVGDEDEPADAMRVELGPLEKYQVGQRLLDARLAGAEAELCRRAELLRGDLPPGQLGRRVLDDVHDEVERLVQASAAVRSAASRVVDVAVPLADGRVLTGTVPGVHDSVAVRVVYSRLGPKHRLRAWVQLLALGVAQPGIPWSAVTIGRGQTSGVAVAELDPPVDAGAVLASLVELYDAGMREPLPLSPDTSGEYADRRRSGAEPVDAAASVVQTWTDGFSGAGDEPHVLVWGEQAPLEALTAEPPRPDEQGAGWPADEPTRFGALARRLWDPLLAAETIRPIR